MTFGPRGKLNSGAGRKATGRASGRPNAATLAARAVHSGRNVKIKDIAARTIKPDGAMVELKKEDVFERDVVKTNGIKVKAMTFSMPSVEVGSIIEYRWREVREGISYYERFQFSRVRLKAALSLRPCRA